MNQDRDLSSLLHLLACPSCFAPLLLSGPSLICSSCGLEFSVVNNVPVLLDPKSAGHFRDYLTSDEGKSMEERYRRQSGMIEKLKRMLSPSLELHNPRAQELIAEHRLYQHCGEGTVVLNVGGGPKRVHPLLINMNIGLYPNVDVVGDACSIPFLEGVCNTVLCEAVLEHVCDARLVVEEMYRVLKPGGFIYVTVPFMFGYHGYPTDFRRYTQSGLESVLARFKLIESGVLIGPTCALSMHVIAYLRFLIPDWPFVRAVLGLTLGWLMFPLKYLDLWLNRQQSSHRLAAGYYFLGQKR